MRRRSSGPGRCARTVPARCARVELEAGIGQRGVAVDEPSGDDPSDDGSKVAMRSVERRAPGGGLRWGDGHRCGGWRRRNGHGWRRRSRPRRSAGDGRRPHERWRASRWRVCHRWQQVCRGALRNDLPARLRRERRRVWGGPPDGLRRARRLRDGGWSQLRDGRCRWNRRRRQQRLHRGDVRDDLCASLSRGRLWGWVARALR